MVQFTHPFPSVTGFADDANLRLIAEAEWFTGLSGIGAIRDTESTNMIGGHGTVVVHLNEKAPVVSRDPVIYAWVDANANGVCDEDVFKFDPIAAQASDSNAYTMTALLPTVGACNHVTPPMSPPKTFKVTLDWFVPSWHGGPCPYGLSLEDVTTGTTNMWPDIAGCARGATLMQSHSYILTMNSSGRSAQWPSGARVKYTINNVQGDLWLFDCGVDPTVEGASSCLYPANEHNVGPVF